jgi:AraC family transcriptional regulator of adaptative response/methylated-DNA-[protein]-cysteine methyltransferase
MPATDQRLNRRVTPKTAPPSEVLRYSIAPCPLGYLLLAASAKGICAVLMGDTPHAVQVELQQRFAEAVLQVDDAGLSQDVQQVVRQLNDPLRPAQLPLDIRGSAFQQQVWVPCHRVIARNGALSGYRWGLQRKAALLKGEADAQGQ